MKMKFLVIGCGFIGRIYLDALTRIDDAEAVAVVDTDLDKVKSVAKRYNIPKYFTDWRDALELDVDVAAVCVPVKYHKEITLEALKRGINVLCEKPPALNSSEAVEMMNAATKYRRILMYGFQWRFIERCIYAKRLIESGVLGKIYKVRIHYLRKEGFPSWSGSWLFRKELAGGGILIDCGVHFIDLIYWLLGRPKPKAVFGVQHDYLGRNIEGFDVEDTYSGVVVFEDDVCVSMEYSWSQIWHEEFTLNIYGTRGSIRLFPEVELVRKEDETYLKIIPELKEPEDYWLEANYQKIRHMVGLLKTGEYQDITPNPEDGVEVMRIIDGLYESSRKLVSVKLS